MNHDQFNAIEHMAKAMKSYDEKNENKTWRELARVAYYSLEDYNRLVENNVKVNQKQH